MIPWAKTTEEIRGTRVMPACLHRAAKSSRLDRIKAVAEGVLFVVCVTAALALILCAFCGVIG